MPTPERGKMVEYILPTVRYLCGYVGWNNIGDEGCRHLSGANWKNLIFLDLRIHADIQGLITLAMRAADI